MHSRLVTENMLGIEVKCPSFMLTREGGVLSLSLSCRKIRRVFWPPSLLGPDPNVNLQSHKGFEINFISSLACQKHHCQVCPHTHCWQCDGHYLASRHVYLPSEKGNGHGQSHHGINHAMLLLYTMPWYNVVVLAW